jgi:hypothetical protein
MDPTHPATEPPNSAPPCPHGMLCAAVLAYLQGQDAYSVDDCLKICLEHGIQVRAGALTLGAGAGLADEQRAGAEAGAAAGAASVHVAAGSACP